VKGGASGTRRREVTSPVAIGDEEGKAAKRNRKKQIEKGKTRKSQRRPRFASPKGLAS
jgi:hypothetical protein